MNEEWGEIYDDIDEYLSGNPEEFMIFEQDDYDEDSETASEDNYDDNAYDEDVDAKVSSTGDSGYSSLRRSSWISKHVTKYGFMAELVNALHPKVKIPNGFDEALKSKEKECWVQEMEIEISSIKSQNTWEIVDLPAVRKPIGCRWVFNLKTDIEGNILHFKASLLQKALLSLLRKA